MINQYAITPDMPGGSRHFDFGVELSAADYSVKIFASAFSHVLRRSVRATGPGLYTQEQVGDVTFVWVRTPPYATNDWRRTWNMLWFAINVVRAGLRIRSRPRAIIGSSPHLLAPLGAWILARLIGSKFVLEVRDLWPQALVDMGVNESSLSIRLLRWLERFLYRTAASIVVLAQGSREYLVRMGVPDDKIEYIPNGVHLPSFDGTLHSLSEAGTAGVPHAQVQARGRQALRRKYSFQKFTAVYTGAHGPANALDTILDAASLLKDRNDIEFVLVGDGPLKVQLVHSARERRLENVRFIDPVPKHEIPALLVAADVGVITLRAADAFSYGVSPNKLFDYMAARKPVVCSVAGWVARVVSEAQCGITVPPEDPEALAQAVVEIAGMTEQDRAALGDRGRRLVEQEYSREKLARKLASVL